MQIVWSDDAVADYHQNIDFLLEKWSVAGSCRIYGRR